MLAVARPCFPCKGEAMLGMCLEGRSMHRSPVRPERPGSRSEPGLSKDGSDDADQYPSAPPQTFTPYEAPPKAVKVTTWVRAEPLYWKVRTTALADGSRPAP